jgi:pilus assembly protein CpaB
MRNIGLLLLALSVLMGGFSVWGLRRLSAVEAKPQTPQAVLTPVAVAARSIAFGEKITPAMVRISAWPQGAAPAGSFRSAAELTAAGRMALGPIAAGEPILAQRLSGPGGRATLANAIRTGMRASAIRIDDVLGVAGFVLPGDTVDVLVTRSEGADRNTMRTDLLLERVRVLAVDQEADQSKNRPVVARTATIEVTPAQAEKLALAGQVGSLSLSLRAPADDAPVMAGTLRTADLGLARPAVARRSPSPPVRLASIAGPRQAQIDIYRGAAVSSVGVPEE